MAARKLPPGDELKAGIDRLYQLPLGEFTAARNALGKHAGKRAAEIKALAKPPVAAWAVNQLYWHRRPVYDALLDAAQELRRAHAAILGGKSADVRAAGKAHEARVAAALDAALEILNESGHAASDAMRQPLMTTLRALPAEDTPGRLARALQPGGFESLAGLSIRGVKVPSRPAPKPVAEGPSRPAPKSAAEAALKKAGARDTKALARARDGVSAAMRAVKQAEHAVQREEFERARAIRDADQATRAVARARDALEEAERALRDAEAADAAAARKKEAAAGRAEQAGEAAEAARAQATAARQELDALSE